MLHKLNPKHAFIRVNENGRTSRPSVASCRAAAQYLEGCASRPRGKALVYDNTTDIRVQRRNNPHFPDLRIHRHNALNTVPAKTGVNISCTDAAIMLDHVGFVSELNDANLFMIRERTVFAPLTGAYPRGITHRIVMQVCRCPGIHVNERKLSLAVYCNTDVVFATGTMEENDARN